MKNIIILSIALLSLALTPKNVSAGEIQIQECPMGSAETLVCEMVLCSIGLAIAESRPKCLKVSRKFAIYLATLGFWSKPPSCKTRDMNCNKVGKGRKASIDPKFCRELKTEKEKEVCLGSLGEDYNPPKPPKDRDEDCGRNSKNGQVCR